MRKIILIFFIFCVAIISPIYYIDATDEDTQKGAEFYWQATRDLNQKNFAESQAKFEEAAQYLSGKVQEDALRMAEFIGQMSSNITAKKLLKSETNFSIIGEVKEEGRVWHLYNDNNRGEMNLLHLAISGEKPLDDLVAALGPDLFTKTMVIQNREGYLSKSLSPVPGASSRIRMWYCDKNNTTNIVYENYYITPDQSYYSFLADDVVSQNNFAKIKCSSSYTWLWVLLAAAFAIIFGAAIFYWRKKIKSILITIIHQKKVLIIIGIVVTVVTGVALSSIFIFSYRPVSSKLVCSTADLSKDYNLYTYTLDSPGYSTICSGYNNNISSSWLSLRCSSASARWRNHWVKEIDVSGLNKIKITGELGLNDHARFFTECGGVGVKYDDYSDLMVVSSDPRPVLEAECNKICVQDDWPKCAVKNDAADVLGHCGVPQCSASRQCDFEVNVTGLDKVYLVYYISDVWPADLEGNLANLQICGK